MKVSPFFAAMLAVGVASVPVFALEDGAAECPASWEFEGRSLPLWYSLLHVGDMHVNEMEPTWSRADESWNVVDLRNEETVRPAYLLCTYRFQKGRVHQIIVHLPDSVSSCILHWRAVKGGNDVFYRRCVWPLGDGKTEMFVAGRVSPDVEVEGLAVRRNEKELEAIAVSRRGTWTVRDEQGERVANVAFPANRGKATIHFSARSRMAREVFVERPVTPRDTFHFDMVKRFGYRQLPTCDSPCFQVWQDDPGFRVEYGGDYPMQYLRLLDLTDPATTTAR
jgi:hypothetical protein